MNPSSTSVFLDRVIPIRAIADQDSIEEKRKIQTVLGGQLYLNPDTDLKLVMASP